MAEHETKDPHSIAEVVEGIEEVAENADEDVRFGDVLDKFGSRSFSPVMMVLALVELSPLGAIPGVPSALALCIFLIAAQMAWGREHIWMPGFVERIGISPDKVTGASDKLEGVADKLDHLATDRMEFLTEGPARRIAAGVIMVLCVAVVPLEILPWASSGPMLAIAIISLALMVRDGLAMMLAWMLAAAAIGAGAWYLFASGGSGGSGGGILPF